MTVNVHNGLVAMRLAQLDRLDEPLSLRPYWIADSSLGRQLEDIFAFDLDGTLIDTKKVTSQVLDDMVLARGGNPNDHEVTDAVLSQGSGRNRW